MSAAFWWYFLLFGGTITLVIAHPGHEHHHSHGSGSDDDDDDDENAHEDEDDDADENESESDEENSICDQYHELLKIFEDNVEISECTPVKIQTSPKVIENVRQWQLTIQGNETTTLNLYRTEGLADNDTEIWIANNPSRKHDKTKYIRKKIYQAAPDLGNFFMYQDRFKKAAIIVFTNGNDVLMEGFIGERVLRRLPNKEYVLLRVTFPVGDFEEIQNTRTPLKNQPIKSYDLKSSRGNTFLRVLVALDANSIGKKSTTETIKCVLMYYNAVDMMFSYFTSPSIHLKLSGIIIPKNDNSMPYFRNVFHDHGHLEPAIKKVVTYFSKPRKNFIAPKSYEFVTGMTVLPLCGNMDTCEEYGAVRYKYVNNSMQNEVMFVGGIVRHPDFHGLYYVTVWQIANGLRSQLKMKNETCPGLTNALVRPDSWSLEWSQCSLTELTEFFCSKESNFLYRSMSYSESHSVVTTTQTVTTYTYEEIVEYEIVELVWTQTITTTVTRWTLTINTKGSSIVLHLHYTGKTLFNGATFVWIGHDSYDGLNNTFYSKHTLSDITRDEFEDFRMYHDRDKKAAITVFFTKNGPQMAGFVGNYVLRRVSENSTKYSLAKTTFPREKQTAMNSVVHNATNSYNLHSQRRTVYPKILAVLDWSSVKGKSRAEIVKNTIVYYNAVDMMFSNFTWPQIKFMVTGIVIPESQLVSYQSRGFYDNRVHLHEAPKGLAVYWQMDGQKLLRHVHADFVTVMTNLPICIDKRTCNFYETFSQRQVTNNQGGITAVSLVRHMGFQGAYGATVKSLTKGLLRFRETAIKACPDFVDPNVEAYKWPLQWSQCSVDQLEQFFMSSETQNWFTLQYTSTVTQHQNTVRQESWDSEEMQSDQAYQVTKTEESTKGSYKQPVNYATSYKTTKTSTTVDGQQYSAYNKSNNYGTTESVKSERVETRKPLNTATTKTTTTTVTTTKTSHPVKFTNKTRKVTTMSGSTRPGAKANAHSAVTVDQQYSAYINSEQYRTGNNVEHVKNGGQYSTTTKTTVTTTATKTSHPNQSTKTVTTKKIDSATPVVRKNMNRTVVDGQYRPSYNNKLEKYSLEEINGENVGSEALKSTTTTKTTVTTTTTTKSQPGKSTATKTITTKEQSSASPVTGINRSTVVAGQQKSEKYRTGETVRVEEAQNIPLNSKSTTKTTVTTTTTQSSYPGKLTTNTSATVVGKQFRPQNTSEKYSTAEMKEGNVGSKTLKSTTTKTTVTTKTSHPVKSTVTKTITTKEVDSKMPDVTKKNTSTVVGIGQKQTGYGKSEKYRTGETIRTHHVQNIPLNSTSTTKTTVTTTTKSSYPSKSTATKIVTTKEQGSAMPVVITNTSRIFVGGQYRPSYNNKSEKYITKAINQENVGSKSLKSTTTTTKTTVTTTKTKTHPGKSTVTKTVTTRKINSKMPDVMKKNTSTVVVVGQKQTGYGKSEKYRTGETIRTHHVQNIPLNSTSTTKTTVTTTTTKSSYPGKSTATKIVTTKEQGSAMPVVITNTSRTFVGGQYRPSYNNKSEKYITKEINQENVGSESLKKTTTTTKTTVTTKTSHPGKSTVTKTITTKELNSKIPDTTKKNTSTVIVGQQQTGYSKSEKYKTSGTVKTKDVQNIPLSSKSTTTTTVTTKTKSSYPIKSTATKTITRNEQGSTIPAVITNTSRTVVAKQYKPSLNNKSEKYITQEINKENVGSESLKSTTTTTKTTVTTTKTETHPGKSTVTKTVTTNKVDSKMPDVMKKNTSTVIVVGQKQTGYDKSEKYRTGETIRTHHVQNIPLNSTSTTKTTVTTTTKSSYPGKSTAAKIVTTKEQGSAMPVVITNTSRTFVGGQYRPLYNNTSEKYSTREMKKENVGSESLKSTTTTKTTVTTTTTNTHPGKSTVTKTVTRKELGSDAKPIRTVNTSATVSKQSRLFNNSEKYRTTEVEALVKDQSLNKKITTTTTTTTTTTKTLHPVESKTTKIITTEESSSTKPSANANRNTILDSQQQSLQNKSEKYKHTLTTASAETLAEKNSDMWEMQSDQGYQQTVTETSTKEDPSRKYFSTNSVISEENRQYQPQEATRSEKFITEERNYSQLEKQRTGGVVETQYEKSEPLNVTTTITTTTNTTISKISASDRGKNIVSTDQIASASVPGARKSLVDEQSWQSIDGYRPIKTKTEKYVSSKPINRTITTTTAKYFYPVGNGVKTSVVTEVMGSENPQIIHPVVSSITASSEMENNDRQESHQAEAYSVFRSKNTEVKTVKNITLSTITNVELSTFLSTLILEQFSEYKQSQSTSEKFQRFSLVLVPEDEASGVESSNNIYGKPHFVSMAIHIDKLLVDNRKDFSKNEASECPQGCCKCTDERYNVMAEVPPRKSSKKPPRRL